MQAVPASSTLLRSEHLGKKEKVEWLVNDAINGAESRRDLAWYVREYFANLKDADLDNEFRDAGGEDA